MQSSRKTSAETWWDFYDLLNLYYTATSVYNYKLRFGRLLQFQHLHINT